MMDAGKKKKELETGNEFKAAKQFFHERDVLVKDKIVIAKDRRIKNSVHHPNPIFI